MKRALQGLLGILGYRLVPLAKSIEPEYYHGLDYFFPALKKLNFKPAHIIDIGANHGEWTRIALKYFPDAYYTLVEPQDQLKIHVQDLLNRGGKIRWINAGAGDRSGVLPFTIASHDHSSTFVTMKPGSAAGLKQVEIPIKTLNQLATEGSAPFPDMVKIDAEGFDLKVLAGASELFGKTDIFLVEALICSTDYDNSLNAVIRTMGDAGYRLIDITDLNRSPKHGVLWLSELAFLRNGSPLMDSVRSYE